MITGELKTNVDKIWDTMWSGGISNPLSVIEQLTYLLFIKRLDELHTVKERKANRTKQPIEEPIFDAEQDHLRWSRFKQTAPEQMFETLRDEVFPFIKSLGQPEDSSDEEDEAEAVESTYSHHMKDAIFMMPTPRVLASVVDQLDSIDMSDRDTKGDLYEYMLGKIASAGQNGQFRTPRHIIQLMVELTAPTPKDIICDPACGTAGFLIAASEHLIDHHSEAIYKNAASRRRFNEDTFHGYDFDSTMLRIGSMNMLLHGVENPDIRYKDSLAEPDEASGDDEEAYSLILANPPFAGSLDYEVTAKDLLKVVKTKKTELLFLALFQKMLRTGGRAAVIVPAGVLEAESKSHIKLRRMLIEDMGLRAVIKLPHWVFKPYASVDTSILLFSKTGSAESVWFYQVDNDGFADDASKSPKLGSELPEVSYLWSNPNMRLESDNRRKHKTVSAEDIRENDYDLCPALYLSGHVYPQDVPLVSIDELFSVNKGQASAAKALDEGRFPFATSSTTLRRADTSSFEGPAICIPLVSATGHGHAAIKTIHMINEKFEAASITAVLTPKSSDISVPTIYYYLLAHKNSLLVPLMRGATNKSLNIDRISRLKVPIFNKNSPEARAVDHLMQLRGKIDNARRMAQKLELEHMLKVQELGRL